MDILKIAQARTDAEEFIRRADLVLSAPPKGMDIGLGSKSTGSLRRQSMELTRALSAMRQS